MDRQTFDDYPKLERVRACFQEAARMFPSTNLVTRDTAEAVVLSLPHTNGSEPLVVPPGVRILIDMIGIHYDEERFPTRSGLTLLAGWAYQSATLRSSESARAHASPGSSL